MPRFKFKHFHLFSYEFSSRLWLFAFLFFLFSPPLLSSIPIHNTYFLIIQYCVSKGTISLSVFFSVLSRWILLLLIFLLREQSASRYFHENGKTNDIEITFRKSNFEGKWKKASDSERGIFQSFIQSSLINYLIAFLQSSLRPLSTDSLIHLSLFDVALFTVCLLLLLMVIVCLCTSIRCNLLSEIDSKWNDPSCNINHYLPIITNYIERLVSFINIPKP